jgi:hypothetical protein
MVILLAGVVLLSVVYKPGAYKSLNKQRTHFDVTLRQPVEIKKIAEWLKNSPYGESPLLTTQIHGQAAYLSLYFPEAGPRRHIVKSTTRYSDIQRFVQADTPCLLITYDDDSKVKSHVEELLGDENWGR